MEHKMDRRKFFKVCAALLGSSVIPVACTHSEGEGTSATTTVNSEATFSKALFDTIPSTSFSVSHDVYGAIDMQLTEVETEGVNGDVEQFSICLTGPDTPVFDEGAYNMYNESLGYIDLYLQPSEGAAGEQKYRAVFSLLIS